MAFTPEEQKKLQDAGLGSSETQTQSLADKLASNLSQSQQAEQKKQSFFQKVIGTTADVAKGVLDVGKKFVQSEGQHFQNFKDIITQGAQDIQKSDPTTAKGFLSAAGNGLQEMLRLGGETVGTVFEPFSTAIKATVGGIADKISNNPQLQQIAQTKGISTMLDSVDMAGQKYSDWAKQHPDLAKNTEAGLQIVLGLAGQGELNKPVSQALQEAIAPIKAAYDKVSPIASDIAGGAKGVISDVKGVATDFTTKAQEASAFNKEMASGEVPKTFKEKALGKTKQDILSTPSDQVYKLKPEERKVWYDEQKTQVQLKNKTTGFDTQKSIDTKVNKIQSQIDGLQTELKTATRDKTIELRPKIRKALADQSAEYRRLVDKEIAPYKKNEIDASNLRTFIQNRYSDNPEVASAIIDKLDIPSDGITTVGNIYDKSVSLRQELSSGAKTGSRVYTPDEKMIDDSISTLNDFLSTQGVDLSAARQFWAKYAPIRNQLVSEAKPFVQSGTQTKIFANTLERVASGKDINNEIFIKDVNSLLGEDVTKNAKDIFSKISSKEKELIATKMDAKIKKLEADLAQSKKINYLNDQQFLIERQARIRDGFKKVILGVLGLEVANKLGILHALGL